MLGGEREVMYIMSQKQYALVSGSFFFIATIAHAFRLLYGWDITVAGWAVPMWVSGTGVVVAGYLSYHGLRLSK